jgi:DNA uptake protein ComE-like DNA-binding protein
VLTGSGEVLQENEMTPSVQTGFLKLKLNWIISCMAKSLYGLTKTWKKFGFACLATLAGCLVLFCLSGCSDTPQKNPAQQQAAQTTTPTPAKSGAQQAIAEAKAAAASAQRGIKEVNAGLKEDLSDDASSFASGRDMVNINYSSEAKLMTLPGITRVRAELIIHNRPYETPLDLVYKHVITKAEYQQIVNRVVAWDNLWATPE